MTDRVENTQERRSKTPLECRDWIDERMENALRIAMTKEGEDRAGWLEDAHYLSSILSILLKVAPPAPSGKDAGAKAAAKETPAVESGEGS